MLRAPGPSPSVWACHKSGLEREPWSILAVGTVEKENPIIWSRTPLVSTTQIHGRNTGPYIYCSHRQYNSLDYFFGKRTRSKNITGSKHCARLYNVVDAPREGNRKCAADSGDGDDGNPRKRAAAAAATTGAETYDDLWQTYLADLNDMVTESQQRLRWEEGRRQRRCCPQRSPLRDCYYSYNESDPAVVVGPQQSPCSGICRCSCSCSCVPQRQRRLQFLPLLRETLSRISQGYFEECADPSRTDPGEVRRLEELIVHRLVPARAVALSEEDREWIIQNIEQRKQTQSQTQSRQQQAGTREAVRANTAPNREPSAPSRDENDDDFDEHGSRADSHQRRGTKRRDGSHSLYGYRCVIAAVSLVAVTIVGIAVVRSAALGDWMAFSRTRNTRA
eukprot:jgi/Psemu1/288280/fgenesh1_pg.251_\